MNQSVNHSSDAPFGNLDGIPRAPLVAQGSAYGPRIERLKTPSALADAVVGLVAAAIAQGIQRRGNASLVFSGGSTPEIFLPPVASLALDWAAITILLADERWVDEQSPLSNTAMLRRTLLAQPGPAKAHYISLKNSAPAARAGVQTALQALMPTTERYDLVLLGMGNDGHIASLFPGTPRLADLLSDTNTERVAAIPAPTTANPPVERISLTLAELKRSERLVLVLQGEAKLDTLKRAWQLADPLQMPVYALGDVEVIWCP
jgi:6-phosphogluconolactonase